MQESEHTTRIKQELRSAGVSRYGLSKMESKYLPTIIHEDEHICGAVYSKFQYFSSMLVATDKRVIFINKEPMLTTTDEITYAVVSGVRLDQAGLFASLILHTRIQDYSIRYVNLKSAQKFISYIEKRRLENYDNQNNTPITKEEAPASSPFIKEVDKEGLEFLKQLNTAVLSTVDRTGIVRGAVINYVVGTNDSVYLLTRSETAKAKGIFVHGQVALTVHEPESMKTVQLEGNAEIEQDPTTKKIIFEMFTSPKEYKEGNHSPPVTKLKNGSYVTIRIIPSFLRYRDYSKQ